MQGQLPRQRRHGRVLQSPEGRMVPNPNTSDAPRIPCGTNGISSVVKRRAHPGTARILKPRRVPNPSRGNALVFTYSVQLSGSIPLLREYFPKGTDLSRWTPEEIEAFAHALNTRPRKTLGWKTPAEAFDEQLLLALQTSVATTG